MLVVRALKISRLTPRPRGDRRGSRPSEVPVEAAAVGRKLGEISLGWLLT